MKELRMSQREVILLPSFDKSMYTAIMNAKFKETGFDIEKPIEKNICHTSKDIIYTQI